MSVGKHIKKKKSNEFKYFRKIVGEKLFLKKFSSQL